MSDRLQELRRQRALVQEHLDWLDREIAGLTALAAAPPAPPTPPSSCLSGAAEPAMTQAPAIAPMGLVSSSSQERERAAEQALAQFLAQSQDGAGEAKRGLPAKLGCWLALILSLLVLAGFVAAVLHFFYR